MSSNIKTPEHWIWPVLGANPTDSRKDGELFATSAILYTETFTREALQNCLDAVDEQNKNPVEVSFNFHKAIAGETNHYLEELMSFRKECKLDVPKAGQEDEITWLTVSDKHTTGLEGVLTDRFSDFWNYHLNFGVSSKPNSSRPMRGGRGIGRKVFLLASSIGGLLTHTRRNSDKLEAFCGLAQLQTGHHLQADRGPYAYFAQKVNGSIFDLHEEPSLCSSIRESFCLPDYSTSDESGFSFVVLYPHEDLTKTNIITAAIDNFAPAIMNRRIALDVNGEKINGTTIESVAKSFQDHFNHFSEEKHQRGKQLSTLFNIILECITHPNLIPLEIKDTKTDTLLGLSGTPEVQEIKNRLNKNEIVTAKLTLPLIFKGQSHKVEILCGFNVNNSEAKPLDRLYREGMWLPDVKSRNTRAINLLFLVEDTLLANYLNLCEGGAHLDLSESPEIRDKLTDEGFEKNFAVKRLVKNLSNSFTILLSDETEKRDLSVFSDMFSIPFPDDVQESAKNESKTNEDEGQDDDNEEQDDDDDQPKNSKAHPYEVCKNDDEGGLELTWNEKYEGSYKDLQLQFFYSDGTSKKSWEKFDFLLQEMDHKFQNCNVDFVDNKAKIRDWKRTSSFAITGFDRNRDVIITYLTTDSSIEISCFSDRDREIILSQNNQGAKITLSLDTGQGKTLVSAFDIPEACPITAVENLLDHGFKVDGTYEVYLKREVGKDPIASVSAFVKLSSEGVFLHYGDQKVELKDESDFWNLQITEALELVSL